MARCGGPAESCLQPNRATSSLLGRIEEFCNKRQHCSSRIARTRRSRVAAACRSRSAPASVCRTASRPSGSPLPTRRPTPTRRAPRPASSIRTFSLTMNHSISYSSACECTCWTRIFGALDILLVARWRSGLQVFEQSRERPVRICVGRVAEHFEVFDSRPTGLLTLNGFQLHSIHRRVSCLKNACRKSWRAALQWMRRAHLRSGLFGDVGFIVPRREDRSRCPLTRLARIALEPGGSCPLAAELVLLAKVAASVDARCASDRDLRACVILAPFTPHVQRSPFSFASPRVSNRLQPPSALQNDRSHQKPTPHAPLHFEYLLHTRSKPHYVCMKRLFINMMNNIRNVSTF